MARLDAFLQLGHEQGVSDVHFAVGVPPMFRMSGELLPIQYRALSNDELEELLREILNEDQLTELESDQDIDFSYASKGVGRFRAHIYRKTNGFGAAFRIIASQIPRLTQN